MSKERQRRVSEMGRERIMPLEKETAKNEEV